MKQFLKKIQEEYSFDEREYHLIFIVDDNLTFLKLLQSELYALPKTKIICFSNGEDCLNKMYLNPSVVVLDYQLSDDNNKANNGLDFLKKIKSIKPDTQVIMLSGSNELKVAISAIQFGASDYVLKNHNALINLKNKIKHSFKKLRIIKSISYSKLVKWQIAAILAIVLVSTFIADKILSIL